MFIHRSNKLGVLAHSQGNVVMGEALKKYSGPPIDAYIASQAALSASFYDNNLPPTTQLSWDFFFEDPAAIIGMPSPVSAALLAQGHLSTPVIYGHFNIGQPTDMCLQERHKVSFLYLATVSNIALN